MDKIPVTEIVDRLKGVIDGSAPVSLLGDRTFQQLAWSFQEISVQIGSEQSRPIWTVKFFIDAGELDYVDAIEEAETGRWFDIRSSSMNDPEPVNVLMAESESLYESLEDIIANLQPLPKVESD